MLIIFILLFLLVPFYQLMIVFLGNVINFIVDSILMNILFLIFIYYKIELQENCIFKNNDLQNFFQNSLSIKIDTFVPPLLHVLNLYLSQSFEMILIS